MDRLLLLATFAAADRELFSCLIWPSKIEISRRASRGRSQGTPKGTNNRVPKRDPKGLQSMGGLFGYHLASLCGSLFWVPFLGFQFGPNCFLWGSESNSGGYPLKKVTGEYFPMTYSDA